MAIKEALVGGVEKAFSVLDSLLENVIFNVHVDVLYDVASGRQYILDEDGVTKNFNFGDNVDRGIAVQSLVEQVTKGFIGGSVSSAPNVGEGSGLKSKQGFELLIKVSDMPGGLEFRRGLEVLVGDAEVRCVIDSFALDPAKVVWVLFVERRA